MTTQYFEAPGDLTADQVESLKVAIERYCNEKTVQQYVPPPTPTAMDALSIVRQLSIREANAGVAALASGTLHAASEHGFRFDALAEAEDAILALIAGVKP
jgi:hypothetical protein